MQRKGMGVIFFDPQSPCDILGPLAATVWGPYNDVRLPLMRKSVGGGSGRTDGVEQWLRLHADGFLVLDQNHLRGSLRGAGQMLHEVAQYAAEGFSDGSPDLTGSFVFMGETNRPPEALLRAAGLELDPSRLIVLPSNTDAGWGPFHHLHAFLTPSRLSVHLQQLLSPLSGRAMSRYPTLLTDEFEKDPIGLVRWFQDYIDYFEQTLREIECDPHNERLIFNFPFIYAVAMSAVYWNLIPLTFDEVAEIIKYCEARCLGHYLDTEGKSDLIIIVVNYIIDNLDKFIELPQEDLDDDTFKNAPGFYTRENGNITKLMFHPPTFRKAMASARPQQVLEALYKGEYIICDFGSYQKKYQVWPGDNGRRNMYQLDPNILHHQPKQPYPAANPPEENS
jgi:hypothetical protein